MDIVGFIDKFANPVEVGTTGGHGIVLWAIVKLFRMARDKWFPRLPDASLYFIGLAVSPLAVVGFNMVTGHQDQGTLLMNGVEAWAAATIGHGGKKQLMELKGGK